MGQIEASLAGFFSESSTPKLIFCLHYFRNHKNFRTAVAFFLLCVKYSGFFGGWVEKGASGCGERGICSQVVRDLPFIDSIFGGF